MLPSRPYHYSVFGTSCIKRTDTDELQTNRLRSGDGLTRPTNRTKAHGGSSGTAHPLWGDFILPKSM